MWHVDRLFALHPYEEHATLTAWLVFALFCVQRSQAEHPPCRIRLPLADWSPFLSLLEHLARSQHGEAHAMLCDLFRHSMRFCLTHRCPPCAPLFAPASSNAPVDARALLPRLVDVRSIERHTARYEAAAEACPGHPVSTGRIRNALSSLQNAVARDMRPGTPPAVDVTEADTMRNLADVFSTADRVEEGGNLFLSYQRSDESSTDFDDEEYHAAGLLPFDDEEKPGRPQEAVRIGVATEAAPVADVHPEHDVAPPEPAPASQTAEAQRLTSDQPVKRKGRGRARQAGVRRSGAPGVLAAISAARAQFESDADDVVDLPAAPPAKQRQEPRHPKQKVPSKKATSIAALAAARAAFDSESDLEVPKGAPPPPKRKRGRPRKARDETPPPNPLPSTDRRPVVEVSTAQETMMRIEAARAAFESDEVDSTDDVP